MNRAISKSNALTNKSNTVTNKSNTLTNKSSEMKLYEIKKYYSKHPKIKGLIICNLCPHQCVIAPESTGICKARKNIKGKFYSLTYGYPVSINIDPIEKKPLYHYYPGMKILSIGTLGCNLLCKGCQNHEISRGAPSNTELQTYYSPQKIVDLAVKNGVKMIAYTYNEPTIFFEYMIDIAKIARKNGIKNVIVSNGYINPEPLKNLLGYIDAANIDLKSFNELFYKNYAGARLSPVLETIKLINNYNFCMKDEIKKGKNNNDQKKKGKHDGDTNNNNNNNNNNKHKVWLELTNLIIPGYNDDSETIRMLCTWVKDNAGCDVPLHFSRFFPYYKAENLTITPEDTLINAKDIAVSTGINYVYIGNVGELSDTKCVGCKELLIDRSTLHIKSFLVGTKFDTCPKCRKKLPGVYK